MTTKPATTNAGAGRVSSTAQFEVDNLDFAGQPVPRNCENCDGLYDDSDGPEYGPPCPSCSIKPHMHYLKGFPFKTPQKCFQIAWWHLVDWDAEGERTEEEFVTSSASTLPCSREGADQPPGDSANEVHAKSVE